jgi:sulfite exporter TauE/SafE
MFVGLLGPAGVQAFNAPQIRRSMATTVFVALGLIMLVWGAIELGLLDMLPRRASAATRAAMSQTTTKAGALGLMVGWFLVGRPYPVMRDFLVYAAAAHSATYGAAVMMIVGLGQILLMVVVFLALALGGGRLLGWMLARPERRALISGISLVAGGSFFVFYWGLAFTLGIGRWGARLGWY